jgi:opacity protein-like surface antigen
MLAQTFGCALLVLASPVFAQNTSVEGSTNTNTSSHPERGAIVVAGKVGGIAPFSKLSLYVSSSIEVGYAFGSKRSMMAYLEASYTVPTASGTNEDNRVPDGKWKWDLWEKQLVLQPTFAYRFTFLSEKITPYAGIGPRIYLIESVTEGSAGGKPFGTTTEKSTKFGVGLPLGAEYQVGPGGVFGELQFQWAPLDHRITGKTNLGAATLFIGYRAYL